MVVIGVLGLLVTCGGTGVLGFVIYVFRAEKTLCVSGTRASITIDGPRSFLAPLPLPLPERSQLLECEPSPTAPILCRHPVGLASTYTVRDNGTLGINLVGDALCEALDRPSGAESPAS